MISFKEALKIVLASCAATESERVPLDCALNRILAGNIVSDVDIPPADLSAMDGFACRKADLDKTLKVIEHIPAGSLPEKAIGPGECSRIMTGAVIPSGAEQVIMIEHAQEENGFVRVVKVTGAANVRMKAEDVRSGTLVLTKGTRITPAVIAVLASAGCAIVNVHKRISVGIIATGNELVEPIVVPAAAQIRNSNGYQLFAQTISCGCTPKYYGIAVDTPESTEKMIRRALEESDVILMSGGVSMGDYDCVPAVLEKLGVEINFDSIAMKPGKPATFGKLGKKAFFGMPGNPVSTFIIFELFVRPYLLQCMGHTYKPLIVKASLKETISRNKTDRLEFYPVQFDESGKVTRQSYNGSAHIHSYIDAEGIVAIQKGTGQIEAGTGIEVRILERC